MTVDSAALEEFDYYEDIEEVDWFFKIYIQIII